MRLIRYLNIKWIQYAFVWSGVTWVNFFWSRHVWFKKNYLKNFGTHFVIRYPNQTESGSLIHSCYLYWMDSLIFTGPDWPTQSQTSTTSPAATSNACYAAFKRPFTRCFATTWPELTWSSSPEARPTPCPSATSKPFRSTSSTTTFGSLQSSFLKMKSCR